MTWNGSFSEDWLSWYDDQIAKLTRINIDLVNASSLGDVDFKVAEMQKVVNGIEREGARYVKEDLSVQFRDSYRSQTLIPGPIPRIARDAAYRDRKRMKKSIDENVRNVRNWVNQAGPATKVTKAYNLLNKQNQEIKLRMNTAKGKDLEGLKADQRVVLERISQLPEFDHPDEPHISYLAKKKKRLASGQIVMRGDPIREVKVSDHMAGVSRRVDATLENRAYLTAMTVGKKSGIMFLVSDGPGCGWLNHDDTDKAHGKVVTFDEAMSHILAHEACRRTFSTFQKPGKKLAAKSAEQLTKASRETMKALNRANSMKLSTLPKTVQQWAEYTSLAATLVGASSAVRRNPAVRLFVMNIAHNTDEAIPVWLKSVSQRFAGFRAMEQRLTHALGMDVIQLRQVVQSEVDNVFVNSTEGAWSDRVTVSKQTSDMLRVDRHPTKDDLYSAYHVFNEHVQFEADKVAGLVGNLNDAILTAELRKNVVDNGMAALDLHTIQGRMPRIPAQVNATLKAVRKAGTIDQEFMMRELVRSGAEMAHLPFTRANIANFRFSVGVSQEGRSRIATGIYDRLVKSDRWTASDISWAKKIGIELPSKVQLSKRDVFDALLPRITWNPGGLLSMGLEAKNGVVTPFGRVYPPGTMRKFLHLESHLSSAGVRQFSEDIMEQLDKRAIHSVSGAAEYFSGAHGRAWMLNRLGLTIDSATGIRTPGLVDDAVTSVHFFRNGPMMARMKFYGAKWEGFAVRAFPDSDVFRLRYRYYRNWRGQASEFNGMTDSQLRTILGSRNQPNSGTRDELLGLLGERDRFSQTDLVLLPTRRGGIRLSQIGDQAQLSLMKLHVYKGNLMGLHKATGLSWTDLVAWEKRTRNKYAGYMNMAKTINWENIRSISDLETVLNRVKLGSANDSIFEVTRAGGKVKTFDEQKVMLDKIMQERFPNLPPMRYIVTKDPLMPYDLAYNERNQTLYIKESVFDSWPSHASLRRKMVNAGVFPPGTQEPAASIAHEMGHSMYDQLPLARKKDLWVKIGEQDWPRTSGWWTYINDRGVQEQGRLERDMYQTLKREGRLIEQLNDDSVDFPFRAIRDATNAREIEFALGHWIGFDRSNRLGRQDRIVRTVTNRVSVVGASGGNEFIGELISEYLTSAAPRELASLVGKMMEAFYGRTLRSVP